MPRLGKPWVEHKAPERGELEAGSLDGGEYGMGNSGDECTPMGEGKQ